MKIPFEINVVLDVLQQGQLHFISFVPSINGSGRACCQACPVQLGPNLTRNHLQTMLPGTPDRLSAAA